jgi:phenylacetate-CoA ligase
MLVVRGINVFPSEIEAVVLDDPELNGQYAIIVDRRRTLAELEVHVESEETMERLEQRLAERLRLRCNVVIHAPGSLPREETGKAKRVFERTDAGDPW